MLHPSDGLDHHETTDPLLKRLGIEAESRPEGAEAARSVGRIPACGDRFGGFLGAVYQRHDHAVGAPVKHAANPRGFIAGNPHDPRGRRVSESPEQASRHGLIKQTVLAVDHHEVVTCIRQRLDRPFRVGRNPRPEHGAVGVPLFGQCAMTHLCGSSLAVRFTVQINAALPMFYY